MRISQALATVLTASVVTAVVWWGVLGLSHSAMPSVAGSVTTFLIVTVAMIVPSAIFLLPVFAWRDARGRLSLWTAVIAGAVEGGLLMVAAMAVAATVAVTLIVRDADWGGGGVVHLSSIAPAIVLATILGAVAGWGVWRRLGSRSAK